MKVTILFKKAFALFFITVSTISISYAQDYGLTVFGTDLISKEEVLKLYTDELQTLKTLYDVDRDAYKTKKEEL